MYIIYYKCRSNENSIIVISLLFEENDDCAFAYRGRRELGIACKIVRSCKMCL